MIKRRLGSIFIFSVAVIKNEQVGSQIPWEPSISTEDPEENLMTERR